MSTNNKLTNRDFERAVKTLRRILPKLSFALLIITYGISAVVMGIFHAKEADGALMMIAAYAVPLAIQAGRGTIVFFFQLNPAKVQSRFGIGIIAASLLLVLSLAEAYLSTAASGIAWTVSVATLMLIGYIIEVMIMKETQFATQMELYQNRDQWAELQKFYVARDQFRQFMDDLYEGKAVGSYPTPDEHEALKQQMAALQEENKHLKNRKEDDGKKPEAPEKVKKLDFEKLNGAS